jgi:hypothetical protein
MLTAWIALWSEACAVIRITGIIGSWSLQACRMSSPVTCGIRTSVTTMSGLTVRIASRPALPPCATETS